MEDKFKNQDLSYLLMGNANPTTQLLELKVTFTEEFNKLAWKMLEEGSGSVEDLVSLLKNNMKLVYTKDGEQTQFDVDVN